MEEYGKEYREKLAGMGRMPLFNEANKMRKRLDKLSHICKVEDAYNASIELKSAKRSAEARKKEISDVRDLVFAELKKRHITYGPGYVSLKDAVKILIDSINQ